MADSPNLLLPWLAASQAQKHVTHNEALRLLDGLVQLAVEDRDLAAPPGAPGDGDCWIVAPGATGVWTGWDGDIAMVSDGVWYRLPARIGWLAWVRDEATLLVRTATGWVSPAPETLDLLGINAAADTTNRLAISAPAVLLSHESAGHQLKINKAAPGDTASVVFQTGFSGRAEMGTAGGDDFSVKVSADGAAWNTAITIAAATGTPDLEVGATIGGARAFARTNILGSVAQSGGVPTGAVIERGANANGSYIRFADGTQICWQAGFTVTAAAAAVFQADWTYPAAFSASPAVSLNLSLVNADWSGLSRAQVSSWGPILTPGTTTTRLAIYPISGVGTVTGTVSGTMPIALGRWF